MIPGSFLTSFLSSGFKQSILKRMRKLIFSKKKSPLESNHKQRMVAYNDFKKKTRILRMATSCRQSRRMFSFHKNKIFKLFST